MPSTYRSAKLRRLLALIAVFAGCFSLETRAENLETWSDTSGKHQVIAEFIDLADGVVHLRTEDGEHKRIQLEKLNEESQNLAIELRDQKNEKQRQRPYREAADLDSLNSIVREDIRPEDNAIVGLWRAVGFDKIDEVIRKRYIKELGLPPDVKAKTKFLPWQEYFEQLGGGPQLGEGYSPLDATDNAAVATWLKINQRSLDLVIEAVERTRYFSPLVNEPGDHGVMSAILPFYILAKELPRALIARAREQLRQGELIDAWESTLACHRMSRLFSREPTFVGYLVALICEDLSWQTTMEIATHDKFNREIAARCLSDLNNLLPLSSTASKVALGAKASALDNVNRIAEGGPAQFHYMVVSVAAVQKAILTGETSNAERPKRPNRWSDESRDLWLQAVPLVAKYYDQWVDSLEVEDPFERNRNVEALLRLLEAKSTQNRMSKHLTRVTRSEKVSSEAVRIFHQGILPTDVSSSDIVAYVNMVTFPDVRTALRKEISARVCAGVSPVVLALGVYRSEQGQYPARLEELVPDLLPEPPVDVVHKSPLVYRRSDDGYVLYSLGPDGVDDGGNEDISAETYDLAVVVVPLQKQ